MQRLMDELDLPPDRANLFEASNSWLAARSYQWRPSLGWRPSLLGARTLLRAPGILEARTLLGAPGRTTRSILTTSSKKLRTEHWLDLPSSWSDSTRCALRVSDGLIDGLEGNFS